MCFFSIITITLNPGLHLKSTGESILSQSCTDFEWIIKDGGSTDGSINLVPDVPCVHKIIRQDKGIYDAMNQAIDVAQGKFLIFLNAADLFADSLVLFKIRLFIQEHRIDARFPCLIAGNWLTNGVVYDAPDQLSYDYLYGHMICHQAIIYSKTFFTISGKYNLHYKLSADQETVIRCLIKRITYYHIQDILIIWDNTGISCSKSGMGLIQQERKRILLRYFGLLTLFRIWLGYRVNHKSLMWKIIKRI